MEQAGYRSARRLGVLGGTFNPIHCGHIEMATGILRRYQLDAVLLIPANDPPHKRMEMPVPCIHRLEMARLAAQGHPDIHVSDLECRRQGKSYTIDTLEALHADLPGARLFVIVGSDMLQDLPTWYRAAELLRMAAFIGVTRQGQAAGDSEAAEALAATYGADVRLAALHVPPVSSTDIRHRLVQALPIGGLVPNPVEAYIYRQGLYWPPPLAMLHARVRGLLSPARFTHTAGVVQTAIWMAERYGINPQQARLAALLHDCGRGEDPGPLTHAHTGARIAREQFGVRDSTVLQAIRRHTTLSEGATDLDMVIYLADMIEPGRDFPGVAALRELAQRDLRGATRAGLEHAVAHMQATGQEICPDSLLALQALS